MESLQLALEMESLQLTLEIESLLLVLEMESLQLLEKTWKLSWQVQMRETQKEHFQLWRVLMMVLQV